MLEARKLSIPIVGLIDTNCDPDLIDFPIPGNDDAMRSISFITAYVADSIIQGRKKFLEIMEKPLESPKDEKKQQEVITEEEKLKAEEVEAVVEEKKEKEEKKKPLSHKAEGVKSSKSRKPKEKK